MRTIRTTARVFGFVLLATAMSAFYSHVTVTAAVGPDGLAAREAVRRAYFAGDAKTLAGQLPQDFTGIGMRSDQNPNGRSAVVRAPLPPTWGRDGVGESMKDTDAQIVAALDTEYQAAVGRNDAATMDRILADDFVLVFGNGSVQTKPELLQEAREGRIVWEQQVEVEDSQKVRVWGDTAVVTAKLWVKGSQGGKRFDRKLWFSDTYVRTKAGWRYVFGQASLPLPGEP
jgi:ketosteroid isomerase-like protein